MFKGTTNRPKPGAIAHELAALGAQSNAFTDQEYTGYWAKAQAEKLPKILDIISDLYLNPVFNAEEIEKERGVIIQEINMYEDDLPAKAQRIFNALMYGDQPAGWDVGGEKDIIKRLGRHEFVAYRDAALCDAGNNRGRCRKVRGKGGARADTEIVRLIAASPRDAEEKNRRAPVRAARKSSF